MVETVKEATVNYQVRCSNCGKLLKPDKDTVLQLRSGHIDDEGEFYPDHDVGYYCNECM